MHKNQLSMNLMVVLSCSVSDLSHSDFSDLSSVVDHNNCCKLCVMWCVVRMFGTVILLWTLGSIDILTTHSSPSVTSFVPLLCCLKHMDFHDMFYLVLYMILVTIKLNNYDELQNIQMLSMSCFQL